MRIRKNKAKMAFLLAIIIMGMAVTSAWLVVHADTDGTELRTTAQSGKFILQLGDDWADTAFELRLDSGVFPVLIKTDSAGSLSMELGGSRTYIIAPDSFIRRGIVRICRHISNRLRYFRIRR